MTALDHGYQFDIYTCLFSLCGVCVCLCAFSCDNQGEDHHYSLTGVVRTTMFDYRRM